jgi:hypothetical protein
MCRPTSLLTNTFNHESGRKQARSGADCPSASWALPAARHELCRTVETGAVGLDGGVSSSLAWQKLVLSGPAYRSLKKADIF